MDTTITGEAIGTAMSAASTASEPSVSTPDPSLVAAGASPAAVTATTPPAATEGSTTTVIDPANPQQTTATEKKGPIPFEAHDTALKNAREKTRQEVEAQYAWAKGIAEPHRQTVSQFYQLLDTEPTQAVEVLIREIANDPDHAPKLRSLLGRLLGSRHVSPAQPSADALPEPDVIGKDDAGNDISLFSASSIPQLVAAIEARIAKQFEQKYGPLEQDFKTRQQRAAEAKRYANAVTDANAIYAEVSQYPGFKEHEQAIAAAMTTHDWDIERAYNRVVVPLLGTQARKDVVASLHDKAAAAGNPPNAASAAASRPKTMAEGFSQLPASAFA